ncbi:hypothetical protein C8J56DRAFT_904407 [Mycena floridula]|nr:hypothetical protein C8J56DRAFT_904407 [Mycena floridula]
MDAPDATTAVALCKCNGWRVVKESNSKPTSTNDELEAAAKIMRAQTVHRNLIWMKRDAADLVSDIRRHETSGGRRENTWAKPKNADDRRRVANIMGCGSGTLSRMQLIIDKSDFDRKNQRPAIRNAYKAGGCAGGFAGPMFSWQGPAPWRHKTVNNASQTSQNL